MYCLRKIMMSLSLFLLLISQVDAENNSKSEIDSYTIIVPGPTPFSLDAISAINCIKLLKDIRFFQVKNESGKTEIVEVLTVWSFFLSLDESYPKGHHRRYDIIVNGRPLDWDKSFIEYGGEMINLRLLFLYRNQYPPKGLDYRNNP